MKHPVLLAVLLLLITATVAPAVEPVTSDPLQPNTWLQDLSPFIIHHAFLTSTDNERQIRTLTAACAKQVDRLLARLAEARTERQVGSLIRAIHNAETARDIAILSIFIHNAEVSGQYGLAQEMRDQVARLRRTGGRLMVAAAE